MNKNNINKNICNNNIIKGGYILRAREIAKKLYLASPITRDVYNWLELNVTHSDIEYKNIIISRGQILTSFQQIRKSLAWREKRKLITYTKSQIDHALRFLCKKNLISKKKYKNQVLITIINYDFYQNSENYYNNSQKVLCDSSNDSSNNEKEVLCDSSNTKIKTEKKVLILDEIKKKEENEDIVFDNEKEVLCDSSNNEKEVLCDSLCDSLYIDNKKQRNNKKLKKEKNNKKRKKQKSKIFVRQIQELYQIFEKPKTEIEISEKTLEFKKCRSAIERYGFEFLKNQVSDYLKYLELADWREKKGFAMWMSSAEACNKNWFDKLRIEEKKKYGYILTKTPEEIEEEKIKEEKRIQAQKRRELDLLKEKQEKDKKFKNKLKNMSKEEFKEFGLLKKKLFKIPLSYKEKIKEQKKQLERNKKLLEDLVNDGTVTKEKANKLFELLENTKNNHLKLLKKNKKP